MRAVNRLLLLTWAKIFLGAVFAEFASFHSNERRSARRILLDLRSATVGRFHHHEFHHAAMSQLPLLYPSSFAGQGQPVPPFRCEGNQH